MLTFTLKEYTITIADATAQGLDNASAFEALYLDDKNHYTSLQAVYIYHNGLLISSVMLGASGGSTGVYEHTALVANDCLVTCCCDTVFCLSLPGLQLLWKTKADLATCFAIYRYRQDFIVHGELDISRLDLTGNLIWQNSGADIFVTPHGDSNLLLLENTIVATDWEFSIYVFDYDGRTLLYTKLT
jgi:hypothetical protein